MRGTFLSKYGGFLGKAGVLDSQGPYKQGLRTFHTGLEIQCTFRRTVSSNLTLSASNPANKRLSGRFVVSTHHFTHHTEPVPTCTVRLSDIASVPCRSSVPHPLKGRTCRPVRGKT